MSDKDPDQQTVDTVQDKEQEEAEEDETVAVDNGD